DIYYILFRHKWKILVCSAIGLLAAIVVPFVWPHVYESEAKLLVKYVVDNRMLADPTGSARVSLPDAAGRNIINTELQILTSLDLAEEVATNVGPDKILGKPKSSMIEAATFIHGHLLVDPNNSDVIRIVFMHPDPAVVQPVLSQVISTYLDRHAQIHRPEGADEFLTQETDQLRKRLSDTEASLRSAKTNLGIISLEDAEKMFSEKITKIQQDLDDSQAALAEHQATVEELSKRTKVEPLPTNAVAAATVNTNTVTPQKVAEYKHVCDILNAFKEQEKGLLLQFLPANSRVKDVREQIVTVEAQKKQLEEENPGLLAVKIDDTKTVTPENTLQNSLIAETAIVAGLQSKIRVLTNELAEVRGHFAAVDAGASAITELERTRKLEEDHYTYYSESLENARIDASLGPGKGSNINTIQNPSPPFRDASKVTKVSLAAGVFGILFGLGLAFFIELYLDHSVRRPADIEARLGVPLFLSIPYRNGKASQRLLKAPPKTALVLRSEALGRSVPLNGTKITIGRLPENTVSIDEG
ncbi:MAG TPA: Wzz/FepE/Etk N-terminal domain-containing protein, partial [Verrucomicrobiae bacterium]